MSCFGLLSYLKHKIRKEACCILTQQIGAALVEFAIISPIFLGILFVLFELGMMMILKLNLQQSLDAGVRLGATQVTTVQNTILQELYPFVNQNQVSLTIQSYPSFAAISGSDPTNLTTVNAGTSGTGIIGNVVRYQIQYPYTPIMPFVSNFFGTTVLLKAVTVSKNEATS